jgi:predicted DNA-binding transcriptional regulator YafY
MIVLIGALLAVLFALLVYWLWRRWQGRKRYAYSERAHLISEAMRIAADLSLVYWSRTEKRYLKRVVTPHELEGFFLKGYDHTRNKIRYFKITRIKDLQIISGSETKAEVHGNESVSATRLLTVALGVTVAVLIFLLLWRSR